MEFGIFQYRYNRKDIKNYGNHKIEMFSISIEVYLVYSINSLIFSKDNVISENGNVRNGNNKGNNKRKDTGRICYGNVINAEEYTYDERGSLTEQEDVIGRTAAYEYDIFGRIIKSAAYEYDGAGNLIKTTEPGEAVYQYVYDKLNRLAKKVNPLGAETLYTYNKDSSLTAKADGNGGADAQRHRSQRAYDVLQLRPDGQPCERSFAVGGGDCLHLR